MSEKEEGKFKKRIKRWLDRTQDGCLPPHIEEDRSYIELSMLRIIEDAKKEFLEINRQVKGEFDKTAGLTHHYGMDLKEINLRMQIHNLDLLRKFTYQWCKKWFGEVKST